MSNIKSLDYITIMYNALKNRIKYEQVDFLSIIRRAVEHHEHHSELDIIYLNIIYGHLMHYFYAYMKC